MSVSSGVSAGTITHPKIPSKPVHPISHEHFDGFGNVQNVTWMRTDESADFPRDGLMLKSLHKAHGYRWIYSPGGTYRNLPSVLWAALLSRGRGRLETTYVCHRPFQVAWVIQPTFQVIDWI